uniref:Uncharacterized protein n=1 Tax=Cuerna arida TaxID=1464854 RepID=A0A1B6EVU1_9HEMI
MDDSDDNQIPSGVRSDHGRCVFCRISDRVRSWLPSGRGLCVSEDDERNFQQTSEAAGFIPDSVQLISDFSPIDIDRTEPNRTRWTRQIWGFLGDYWILFSLATTTPCICIVYGFVFLTLTFFLLQEFENSFLILLSVSLLTVLSLAFPVFCWRSGLLDRLESGPRRRQRAEDRTHSETLVGKPPPYETLVFTTPESAMSSLPPPSYEVAIQATEVPQILSPQCSSRDANIAVPLCSVHQQSSTSLQQP